MNPRPARCDALDTIDKAQAKRIVRIFKRLRSPRHMRSDELWIQAWFFSLSPEQRCEASLESSRRLGRTRLSRKPALIEPPSALKRIGEHTRV